MQQILERLAAANIQLLPITAIENHFVFERDGFIALVERTKENGFGKVGSAGLLTERGMAVLISRGERNLFVAKGFELEATPDQVRVMRRFDVDLRAALGTA
ncbi:MAG: hypothetical protein HYZ37_08260 [Candidatus Solibacter usitatus]|nr:hypothetical protein [Candidatus Solibacter usitatus]